MKHRKRRSRALTVVAPAKQVQQNLDVARITYDLARLSAETIYHRTALARNAMVAGGDVYNSELVTMSAEKILAGAEAAAIAMQHIAPVQQACLDFWFGQLRELPVRSMHSLRSAQDGMRLSSECLTLWARLASLSTTALLAQSKPLHRTVSKNARRLRGAA